MPPLPPSCSLRPFLAALAFVGLCGVLTGDSGTRLPIFLQSVAGVLALLALAVAALGLLLVAVVAWPLGAPVDPAAGAHRLRAVVLTCVAVALTALSASSDWWPQSAAEPGQPQAAPRVHSVCRRSGHPRTCTAEVSHAAPGRRRRPWRLDPLVGSASHDTLRRPSPSALARPRPRKVLTTAHDRDCAGDTWMCEPAQDGRWRHCPDVGDRRGARR